MIAKTQWTRIFGVLLCCALMLGILPVTACTDVTPLFGGGSGTEADP